MQIISGQYLNPENTRADLVIDHPEHGAIPYTYDPADPHGCVTADEVAAFAPAAFEPPTQAELDAIKAVEERAWRDAELINVIDPKQLALVWEGLTVAEQAAVRAGRDLLLAYPQTADFPNGERPVVLAL